jgi:hypothetical protein
MKASYLLLAPLAASALVGCTVYRPVAYEPTVVTTPATVAVAPTTYVAPNTVVLGAGAVNIDTDGDGYADRIDRFPYDARWH